MVLNWNKVLENNSRPTIPLGIPSKKRYSLGPTSTTVLGPSNFLFDSSGTCVPPFYREAELQWTIYSNGMPLPFYRTTRLIKSLESTVEGHHSIEDCELDLEITHHRRNYPELTRGHLLFDRLQLHRTFHRKKVDLECFN